MPRRDVAAAGRAEQQNRHTWFHAAVLSGDDRVTGEAFLPMGLRRGIAEFGQHPGQALMGFRKIGIDGECGLIMHPCAGAIAFLEQQIGKHDVPERVAGVVLYRLRMDGAGGRAMAAAMGKNAQFGQRGEMRRIEAQRIDVEFLRGFILAIRGQPTGLV